MKKLMLLLILGTIGFSLNLTLVGKVELDGNPIKVFIGKGYSIIATYQGKIYATDLRGNVIGEHELGEEIYGLDVSGSVIYVTTKEYIHAFSLNLRPIASIEVEEGFLGAIDVFGPFAVLADYNVGLFHLDIANEEVKLVWGYRGLNGVMPLALKIAFSPYQEQAEVIFGDMEGKLYSLSLKGEVLNSGDYGDVILSIDSCGNLLGISKSGGFVVGSGKKGKLMEKETKGPTFVAFDDLCSKVAVAENGKLTIYDLNGKAIARSEIGKPITLSWSRGIIVVGEKGKVTFYVLGRHVELPVKEVGEAGEVEKVNETLPSLG